MGASSGRGWAEFGNQCRQVFPATSRHACRPRPPAIAVFLLSHSRLRRQVDGRSSPSVDEEFSSLLHVNYELSGLRTCSCAPRRTWEAKVRALHPIQGLGCQLYIPQRRLSASARAVRPEIRSQPARRGQREEYPRRRVPSLDSGEGRPTPSPAILGHPSTAGAGSPLALPLPPPFGFPFPLALPASFGCRGSPPH